MNRRLLIPTIAVAALIGTWAVVSACDKAKESNTTAAAAATSAKAGCSYEKGAVTADARGECSWKSANVTAAAHGSCSSKASTVTASAHGECPYASGAGHESCAAFKSANVTAAHEGCTVSRASAAVFAAGASGKKVDAVLTGSSCSGLKSSDHTASKTGCAICDEYATCDEKLTIAGAVTQVVPLKNGVMFVYTANVENKTHAVQAAVHRRNDRIAEIAAAGVEVPLCDGCKAMRGAMASGKLHREVVNIEGGSLTLVTSEDPTVVKALQEYSGLKAVKS